MTLAITFAGWLLIFSGYFAFAFGLAVLLGKAIAYGQRPIKFEDHGRERLGMDASISDFAAEREARVQRARWAAQRRGKSA